MPQDLNCFLDVVVNDLVVEVMFVRLLQQLTLMQQSLQAAVLLCNQTINQSSINHYAFN